MNTTMVPATVGVAAAIAITTAMDATGYTMFSALPLFPLAALLWYLQRLSRVEVGLIWGPAWGYALALAYPAVVLGSIALIAFMAGAVDTSAADWVKTLANVGILGSSGIIMVLIMEEGFFRGWLWASLKRAGKSDLYVLVWTSVAFSAWHISAISLDTGFDVPAKEIPIYLVNATLLGIAWGLVRLASGSVVAAAVCHAVWNAVDYPLFGFGEKVGALGIEQTHVYGPEVGAVGVGVNLAVVAFLFYRLSWIRK